MSVRPVLTTQELARLLQRAPAFPDPRASAEQFPTPANIAADILSHAFLRGDIDSKMVVDLGCGTGIFAVGAKLLGAGRVVGIDSDPASVRLARAWSEDLGIEVEWRTGDVSTIQSWFDTCVMNTPFGVQRRGADRPFLDTALRNCKTGYSLHHAETADFVRKYLASRGALLLDSRTYNIPIRYSQPYHRKPVKDVKAALVVFASPPAR
jgi:putative methylase